MLTGRLVVANGEVWRHITGDVGKTLAGTVLCGATDMSGGLPHNLGEVAPRVEVRHARICFTVEAAEPVDLTVIEEVGDDCGDVVRFDTGGDVLAVPATIDTTVMD